MKRRNDLVSIKSRWENMEYDIQTEVVFANNEAIKKNSNVLRWQNGMRGKNIIYFKDRYHKSDYLYANHCGKQIAGCSDTISAWELYGNHM